jgi:hypothetical protein
MVEMLCEHGISIFYDMMLEISAQLGDAAVSQYIEDGVVCPPVMRKGLFTTSAMDNIDHSPTATTATTSFHGTIIYVFQYPTEDNQVDTRDALLIRETKVKIVPELPDSFTSIRPAYFTQSMPKCALITPQLDLEYEWLEKVFETKKA